MLYSICLNDTRQHRVGGMHGQQVAAGGPSLPLSAHWSGKPGDWPRSSWVDKGRRSRCSLLDYWRRKKLEPVPGLRFRQGCPGYPGSRAA